MKSKMFYSVIGNIGSGKSTFIEYLDNQLNAKVFYEKPENYIFLKNAFDDPIKWSFHNQLDFILIKYNELIESKSENDTIIQEMDFKATHKIWTPVLKKLKYITTKEETLLNKIYETLLKKRIDSHDRQIIYIQILTPFKTIIDRIKKRNRDFEDVDEIYKLVKLLENQISIFFSKEKDYVIFNNSYNTFDNAIENNKKILFEVFQR